VVGSLSEQLSVRKHGENPTGLLSNKTSVRYRRRALSTTNGGGILSSVRRPPVGSYALGATSEGNLGFPERRAMSHYSSKNADV
jgi:hypothetical protein